MREAQGEKVEDDEEEAARSREGEPKLSGPGPLEQPYAPGASLGTSRGCKSTRMRLPVRQATRSGLGRVTLLLAAKLCFWFPRISKNASILQTRFALEVSGPNSVNRPLRVVGRAQPLN